MNCPGCNTVIPQGDNKCPMCGAKIKIEREMTVVQKPVQVQSVTEVHHHHHQTPVQPVVIEATSKKWKRLQIVSLLLICFGVVSCVAAAGSTPPNSSFMGVASISMFGGFAIYIVARVGAWWHHG